MDSSARLFLEAVHLFVDLSSVYGELSSSPLGVSIVAFVVLRPPTTTTYGVEPGYPSPGEYSILRPLSLSSPHQTVQEYLPACHRLRLSAST